jgi:hypothetical protein
VVFTLAVIHVKQNFGDAVKKIKRPKMQPDKPEYIHPYIISNLDAVYKAIEKTLCSGISCKIISGYRDPKEQFELFKRGRTFINGKWRVTDSNKVLTDKDGYLAKSAHNYLPSAAIDIGLFDVGRRLIYSSHQYTSIIEATGLKLSWKTDTRHNNRRAHLEIPVDIMFQHNIEKDNAMIWQTLLRKAGTYFGEIDGIFGHWSTTALAAATGCQSRNTSAWHILNNSIDNRVMITA